MIKNLCSGCKFLFLTLAKNQLCLIQMEEGFCGKTSVHEAGEFRQAPTVDSADQYQPEKICHGANALGPVVEEYPLLW